MMMNRTRDELIDRLAADLPSGQPRWHIKSQAALWLLFSTLVVILLLMMMGPLRPGVVDQLLTVPRFLLETLLGATAITLLALLAVKTAVPAASTLKLVGFTVLITLLWLSNYVIGLYLPTMELGMLGKRDYCLWETLVYALPTMVLGFWLVNKAYVVNWPVTGLIIGAVAGLIPGYLMQLACMYDAEHILIAHIGPVLPVMLLGVLAGFVFQHQANKK